LSKNEKSVEKLILLRTGQKHRFGFSKKKFFVDLGIFVTKKFFSDFQNRVFRRSGAKSIFQVIFQALIKFDTIYGKIYIDVKFDKK
jgi:hypothetical protein